MTLRTSRGLPVPRPRRKATRVSELSESELGAYAVTLAGGQPCHYPAILRDPASGEPRCASRAMTVDEVN